MFVDHELVIFDNVTGHRDVNVMLHETIPNDDFSSTKRCNIVASYNIATLCCTKNRRCESPLLRSPLE